MLLKQKVCLYQHWWWSLKHGPYGWRNALHSRFVGKFHVNFTNCYHFVTLQSLKHE